MNPTPTDIILGCALLLLCLILMEWMRRWTNRRLSRTWRHRQAHGPPGPRPAPVPRPRPVDASPIPIINSAQDLCDLLNACTGNADDAEDEGVTAEEKAQLRANENPQHQMPAIKTVTVTNGSRETSMRLPDGSLLVYRCAMGDENKLEAAIADDADQGLIGSLDAARLRSQLGRVGPGKN